VKLKQLLAVAGKLKSVGWAKRKRAHHYTRTVRWVARRKAAAFAHPTIFKTKPLPVIFHAKRHRLARRGVSSPASLFGLAFSPAR